MIAIYKPSELTPVSFELAASIFRTGLTSLMGTDPPVRALALALAKVTLESGRKGMELLTSCHCGNPGNIKAGPDYVGMFTLYGCNEIFGETVKWFSESAELTGKGGQPVPGTVFELPPDDFGHPQSRFRAYAGPTDGIYQYLDFIFNNRRWRDAKEELIKGDPIAYVHALKAKGYFTADEATYARGVVGLHSEFVAKLQGRAAPQYPAYDLTGVVAPQPFNIVESQASLNAAFAGRAAEIDRDNTAGALREMSGGQYLSEPDDNERTIT